MTPDERRAQTAKARQTVNARQAAHTPQANEKRATTWATRIDDDIRWLADAGGTVDSIASRLGIKPSSLKRRLQRRGEWELLDRIRTGSQWQKTGRRTAA